MGCSEGRETEDKTADPLIPYESLRISAESADKIVRKYAPFPIITPPQLQRILSRLDLLPLTPSREAFYLAMSRSEGFIRLHFLVSLIMQGTGACKTKLRLLFEVMDERSDGVISREVLMALIDTMVYISFVYPRKLYPKASSLPSTPQELNRISTVLMEKIAIGVSVASYDMVNLATQENWKDIGTPAGMRRLISLFPAKKEEKVLYLPIPTEEEKAEIEENKQEIEGEKGKKGLDSKRKRNRIQTERGKQISEFIRQKTIANDSTPFASTAKSTPNPRISPRFFAPSPMS